MVTSKQLEISKALRAKFDPSEVRQRSGRGGIKLDYLGIDSTINRVLDVSEQFNVPSEFRIIHAELSPVASGGFFACVHGRLEISGRTWDGTGAATGNDPDDVIKTAQAEAIKKAGHGFGIGLYLWDEKERDQIAQHRAVANGDIKALQAVAKQRAKQLGYDTSREGVCQALGISVEDLFDADVLREVLASNGSA